MTNRFQVYVGGSENPESPVSQEIEKIRQELRDLLLGPYNELCSRAGKLYWDCDGLESREGSLTVLEARKLRELSALCDDIEEFMIHFEDFVVAIGATDIAEEEEESPEAS